MELVGHYPIWFLIGVGAMVLTNLGLIWAVAKAIFTFGMFVQETRTGIANATESAKLAHKRLNGLEGNRR